MLLKMEVGNGKETFLWLDNWPPLGPLVKVFSEKLIKAFSSSRNARVGSIIQMEAGLGQ